MSESLDQLFVSLKKWALDLFPSAWQPLASVLLSIVPIMAVFPMLFALTTVIERKGLGRIQNRLGPNRVGPYGILQFAADGIKALIKEDIVPRAADRVVHFLAPISLVVPVFLGYSVLPFGRNMVPLDLPETGLLFFFAVGAATELSVFMAGWSSRNKYSFLGAMRAIAQMISYEMPLILSTVSVVMIAGSLSLEAIVKNQLCQDGDVFAHWNLFTPWGLVGFVLFFIAASAESNRTPFDLIEAESELVAGYFTEYTGFKFALFFLGEYLGMFAMSGLGITLFLGGWSAPMRWLDFIPSWGWFMGKLVAMIFLFIWIRGTIPRLKTDQLMNFAWKFLLPMTLVNLLAAAVWHLTGREGWHWAMRWLTCAALLAVSWLLLSRGFARKIGKREYRYAN